MTQAKTRRILGVAVMSVGSHNIRSRILCQSVRKYKYCLFIYFATIYGATGPTSRVFANGPEDTGSIPGWVKPKIQWYLMPPCLTQHYRVRIKGKVEQFREMSSAPLRLGVVPIEKGAFGLPSTKVAKFTYLFCNSYVVCEASSCKRSYNSLANTFTFRLILLGNV